MTAVAVRVRHYQHAEVVFDLGVFDPDWDPIDYEDDSWQEKAACLGLGDLFFSDLKPDVAEARAVCADCPARNDCLDYAILYRFRHGIWGGLRWWRERARLCRRERRWVSCDRERCHKVWWREEGDRRTCPDCRGTRQRRKRAVAC